MLVLRAGAPLAVEHGEEVFAAPGAFVSHVVDEVSFLAEAEAAEAAGGGEVFGVGGGDHAVFPERGEGVAEDGFDGFGGEAAVLVVGVERDAELELLRRVFERVEAAVADQCAGVLQGQRELEPGAGRVGDETLLAGDEAVGVGGAPSVPGLKAGDLGERAIGADCGRVVRSERAEAQAGGE